MLTLRRLSSKLAGEEGFESYEYNKKPHFVLFDPRCLQCLGALFNESISENELKYQANLSPAAVTRLYNKGGCFAPGREVVVG